MNKARIAAIPRRSWRSNGWGGADVALAFPSDLPEPPGQLDRQHGGAVLERHHLGAGRPVLRVDQRQHAEHPRAW